MRRNFSFYFAGIVIFIFICLRLCDQEGKKGGGKKANLTSITFYLLRFISSFLILSVIFFHQKTSKVLKPTAKKQARIEIDKTTKLAWIFQSPKNNSNNFPLPTLNRSMFMLTVVVCTAQLQRQIQSILLPSLCMFMLILKWQSDYFLIYVSKFSFSSFDNRNSKSRRCFEIWAAAAA